MTEPTPYADEVRLTKRYLIPVKVFGTETCHNCMDDLRCRRCGEDTSGYGLSDAIFAWSDCNRYQGQIYRFRDDEWDTRTEKDGAIVVWVPELNDGSGSADAG